MNRPEHSNHAHWIILFDSIHHVIAAEEVFKQQRVWCELVPVPRDLSSDCGMAIQFRSRDFSMVRPVLGDPRLRVRGVYRPDPRGYTAVTGATP